MHESPVSILKTPQTINKSQLPESREPLSRAFSATRGGGFRSTMLSIFNEEAVVESTLEAGLILPAARRNACPILSFFKTSNDLTELTGIRGSDSYEN